ncbi:hypothetical protein M422DRAFT_269879 [Sphaerobolus stellatus SS14]|uniref:Uncharacterized protein n=1 Tax=Sphaerobolus stellatus (strain SS14) TaxID=990650 RepID=A0A0C9UUF9_SPHS4|nr:hypothetical protein M422DRAFT_269879 [Sphaerobolus stellatus SS14]
MFESDPSPSFASPKGDISCTRYARLKDIHPSDIDSWNSAHCRSVTLMTSFYDVFSTLGSQPSLRSLLDGTEGCELRPKSPVHLRCWNTNNQRSFEVNFILLDSEEGTSDLAKLLSAVKQLHLVWIPLQFKIPPLPSATVLRLNVSEFDLDEA